MPSSSIPRRSTNGHKYLKKTSLRALAVAAQLERNHAQEGPPGKVDGRAESRPRPERRSPERRTPDPA